MIKYFYKYHILLLFGLSVSIASGQDVIETAKPDISSESRQLIEKVFSLSYEGLDTDQLNDAIRNLEEILEDSDHEYTRYLITFHLTFFYAQAKDYEKCLDLLEVGQQEGFFFPAVMGSRTWPEYLPELKKLERFDVWLEENKRRKE